MDKLDQLYLAIHYYRINRIEECHQACDRVLRQNPRDQAAWCLKMACFTENVYVDELENDEAGIADTIMDDNVIATAARPGTSLTRPLSSSTGVPSPAIRPLTSSGRPVSGVQRPQSRLRTGAGMEQALRTSRTARTARPVSATSARQARLGTASMYVQQDDVFVNLARLNVEKYAADKAANRYLFEYVFLHEADIKIAHQIASTATKTVEFSDWFWKNQLGKCYYRLGMVREAENQFKSSLNSCKMVETYAYLSKVYRRLDQPLSAIERLQEGLEYFQHDITLLTFLARLYEDIGDTVKSVQTYRELLKRDASNVEGIACIATNFFYTNQAEVALKYYRRLLQMGVTSAELYLNIALCCFYCQQFDLSIGCLDRAHALADNNVQADLWYNTAHIAIANGDMRMAERSLRIALAADPDHAESLCNLGVLKLEQGKLNEARTFFQSAILKGPHLYESHYNYAFLQDKMGNYAECYKSLKKALELFPDHFFSRRLLIRVENVLSS